MEKLTYENSLKNFLIFLGCVFIIIFLIVLIMPNKQEKDHKYSVCNKHQKLYTCPNNTNVKVCADSGTNWGSFCPPLKTENFMMYDQDIQSSRSANECIAYECGEECHGLGYCSSPKCQKCMTTKCPHTNPNLC